MNHSLLRLSFAVPFLLMATACEKKETTQSAVSGAVKNYPTLAAKIQKELSDPNSKIYTEGPANFEKLKDLMDRNPEIKKAIGEGYIGILQIVNPGSGDQAVRSAVKSAARTRGLVAAGPPVCLPPAPPAPPAAPPAGVCPFSFGFFCAGAVAQASAWGYGYAYAKVCTSCASGETICAEAEAEAYAYAFAYAYAWACAGAWAGGGAPVAAAVRTTNEAACAPAPPLDVVVADLVATVSPTPSPMPTP